jgi:hypothetical protein
LLVTPPRVGLRHIPGKGRGVVALVAAPAGTELERSSVILVARQDVPVREGAVTAFGEYLPYTSDTPDEELAPTATPKSPESSPRATAIDR